MDQHGTPDFITVRELRGSPGPLDQLLPDSWKKRLFKGRLPALGLRDAWKDGLRAAALLAALALGLYGLWRPHAPECAGQQAEVRLLDTTGETLRVCAATDAERALLHEYLLRQAAAETDIARFDSLLNQLLAQNITLDTQAHHNVSNSAYNAALPDYRAADSLRQTQSGYQSDTSEYRRRACAWFARAAATAPLPRGEGPGLPWISRAAAWCAAPDTTVRIAIRPAIPGRVLDSATGAPLPGVRVQGPGADLRTTADGHYTLRLPASYQSPQVGLRFSAAGYETQTRTFIVEGADSLPALPLVKIPPAATTEPAVTDPQPGKDQPTTGQTEPGPARPGEQTALPLPDPIRKLEADMVAVAGGTFTMGCQDEKRDGQCYDDEKPPRQVRVADFAIGRFEVTQAQWRAVMGSDPPELYNTGCDECPVERVSWNDIQEFLKKLNALTGKTYRLPSEAEWEYAARGGAKSRGYLYGGSNNLDEVGWYAENAKKGNTFGAQKTTRPVGTKKPNELGLYDMSGNVWEWVEDDWHGSFSGAPTDGRAWVDGPRGVYRVYRGGGWGRTSGNCRAAARDAWEPTFRDTGVGFRLAL
ncbi:MAG: SUMF1/EgtB/PvdO family nonheme iron enzyme [Saprospiraceae bacterium]|nr:SUMF1/EgtB/PvdO family nonheme iron enzyme [Saprospiraceae bacterium]